MTDGPVLVTRELTKRFGERLAVDKLNLHLNAGEVYGLLGPNGSGKSTTVAMILALVRPSSGQIEVFGLPLQSHRWEILRRVGAIVESPAFYPYLSGRDNLRIYARAIGVISERQIDDSLDRVDLLERADDRYDEYSLGMKQRLGIASTLLRDPQLIILDEPTNGLDPAGTIEIRALIPRLASEGRTVLVCSHLLYEVEQTCERVTIMQRGQQLTETTVHDLLQQERGIRIRIDGDGAGEGVIAALRSVPWVRDIRREEDSYLRVMAPADRASEMNRILVEHGIYVAELTPVHPTLESVFLEFTGDGSKPDVIDA
ncbi:MAG TPA: ABC transporter ATP-binding protein [Dehalococcoidia bacterium]|nr:ABC transporter ATP-binding protein [Dehalococcoidia bacterium]